MRTPVSIDDDLLRQAKETAVETGRTLSEVVGDALREVFHRRSARATYRVKLITAGHGSRAIPGLDFSDNSAVRAAMDEEWDRRQLTAGDTSEDE
jgi:hypothetical protein